MYSEAAKKEISVKGRVFTTARLRYEWSEYLEDPVGMIQALRQGPTIADLFTFVTEVFDDHPDYSFPKEPECLSVLTIKDYESWWNGIGFKVRNKIRKPAKCGVELRMVQLDDDFVKGVDDIYNESPVRQNRKFVHYRQGLAITRKELHAFSDRAYLVGAYHGAELIGFMKLLRTKNVLRTVHIIAKLAHREIPVMDALIAKGVELCDQNKIKHLLYGSWTDGGLGDFRLKHGFVRVEVPRYFVPLNQRGRLMLRLSLHRPLRERLPKSWVEFFKGLRARWNSFRQPSDLDPKRETTEASV